MSVPEPWLALNEKRDDFAAFVLVVDQLEHAVDLADSRSPGKQRIALLTLDSVAETLLHRHAQRVFDSESWLLIDRRRYTREERDRIERRFPSKVETGKLDGLDPKWPHVPAILDETDAGIFLLGHKYRNGILHRDHHNPDTLPIVTKIYAAAVCRSFVRSTPARAGRSIGSEAHVLERFGYKPESRFASRTPIFQFREAAETIVESLSPTFALDLTDGSKVLTEDLLRRSSLASGLLDSLRRDGLTQNQLESMVRWHDFWDQNQGDPELVRLSELSAKITNDLKIYSSADRMAEARETHQQIAEDQGRRMAELSQAFKPSVEIDSLPGIDRLAARLSRADTDGTLLKRYHDLDRKLSILETTIEDTAISWDRYVEELVDEARGK